jgi:hypothetical protein
VTTGNIAELAATAFVALFIVLLSVRTIGYRGEHCNGGEGVSQSLLKDQAFLTFPDQNPPFELPPENWRFVSDLFMECIVAHPSTGPTLRFPSAVDSRVDWRSPSEGKGHTFRIVSGAPNFIVLQPDARAQTETVGPSNSRE